MRKKQRVLRLKDKYDRPILSGELNVKPFIADVKQVYSLGEHGFIGIVTVAGLIFKVVSSDTYTWSLTT